MPVLDTAILTGNHLTFFLVAFIAVFLWGKALIVRKAKYAGTALAVTVVGASLFVLPERLQIMSLVLAVVTIILIGRSDDLLQLSAGRQFIWQLVIAVILVGGGWSIPYVTNPFGSGVIQLGFIGSFLAILWFLFFMNAINWIDGVDGLAGGVGTVAFLALAAVSLLPSIQDPIMLVLALIGAGATLGFTLWNSPPAHVYLGTVGSWFLGIFLALTAMYGGGKIITTLLILALPVLDALYVAFDRIVAGIPPWRGDVRRHLHHRLLSVGARPLHIMLLAALVTACFAALSLVLSTVAKAVLVTTALLILIIFSRGWIRSYTEKNI